MEAKRPNFSQDAKRAAVELWKAKVPLKNIREQLQMSERTLRRVLAAAKASPEDPVPKRKKTSGRPAKVMATTLIVMRRHLVWDPTLTAGQLKALMPALANTSIRTIQQMCLEKLKLVVGTEDGQHPVPEEPGGVDAEEAAGRHRWQWQCGNDSTQ